MREIKIIPKNGKSISELVTYYKNGCYITRETIWRSGMFVVYIPETEIEIERWVRENGIEPNIFDYLPNDDNDNNEIYMNDLPFDFENINLFDGCSENYIFDNVGLEKQSVILNIINNNYFEILEDEYDWNCYDVEYVIYGGVYVEE